MAEFGIAFERRYLVAHGDIGHNGESFEMIESVSSLARSLIVHPEANPRRLRPPGERGAGCRARRWRDVLAEIISDLGHDGLSEGQRQLARHCATIAIACERMEGEAAQGNADYGTEFLQAATKGRCLRYGDSVEIDYGAGQPARIDATDRCNGWQSHRRRD